MIAAKSCSDLRAGDSVDVLPWDAALTAESSEVGFVFVVGPEFVILTDGRPYSLGDGMGFGSGFGTRIRPAKPDSPHRVISRRVRRSISLRN